MWNIVSLYKQYAAEEQENEAWITQYLNKSY